MHRGNSCEIRFIQNKMLDFHGNSEKEKFFLYNLIFTFIKRKRKFLFCWKKQYVGYGWEAGEGVHNFTF